MAERCGIAVRRCNLTGAAAVLPPIEGRRLLYLEKSLRGRSQSLVLLHEIAHVLGGHADELTSLATDETRYPIEDRVADAVAVIGITTETERALPPTDLADWLRAAAPLSSRAWQVYRTNDVARAVHEIESHRTSWTQCEFA